jgi:hypothetical protein
MTSVLPVQDVAAIDSHKDGPNPLRVCEGVKSACNVSTVVSALVDMFAL